MLQKLAIGIACAAVLAFTVTSVPVRQQFGSEKEARAMLDKAIAALKENKAKALEMFNKGAKAASRIVISMYSAPTPQTAFSPRIPT